MPVTTEPPRAVARGAPRKMWHVLAPAACSSSVLPADLLGSGEPLVLPWRSPSAAVVAVATEASHARGPGQAKVTPVAVQLLSQLRI
eukprot:7432529-Pyramimonas_sp.AAC.1